MSMKRQFGKGINTNGQRKLLKDFNFIGNQLNLKQ